jgi:environmental stress-induced protein Ves
VQASLLPGMLRLPAKERRRQPWKNGGGVTSEVCVFPAGSSLNDFDWRISIAEVTSAGPFSRFPGIDRVLTVLEGELELHFDGEQDSCLLTAGSAPLHFSGETPCDGRPRSGTVRDLNIMVRRDTWALEVERILLDGRLRPLHLVADDGYDVLVAISACEVTAVDAVVPLGPLDALLLPSAASPSTVQGPPGGIAVLAQFRRL